MMRSFATDGIAAGYPVSLSTDQRLYTVKTFQFTTFLVKGEVNCGHNAGMENKKQQNEVIMNVEILKIIHTEWMKKNCGMTEIEVTEHIDEMEIMIIDFANLIYKTDIDGKIMVMKITPEGKVIKLGANF